MPRLALYQPDIPQNTGTILRMAACLGVAVDVIAPMGFDMTDRALRRAGIDYLDHVEISRHGSFDEFNAWRLGENRRLILFTSHGAIAHHACDVRARDVLLLGRESAGVPEAVHRSADARVRIPMRPGLRSLNIAVAAAMALSDALQKTCGWPDALAMPGSGVS
jgi:tRNA (cytidine/uridine-2'-O-)-methyltransferase